MLKYVVHTEIFIKLKIKMIFFLEHVLLRFQFLGYISFWL